LGGGYVERCQWMGDATKVILSVARYKDKRGYWRRAWNEKEKHRIGVKGARVSV